MNTFGSIVCIIFISFIACFIPVSAAAQSNELLLDNSHVFWPAELKRSSVGSDGFDGDVYAFPGLRGLRGKRDPTYNKRVPMMSLKGLRGKRARFEEMQ